MKKILVTGGCGYIGSHTIIDLIQNGFEVISVDNYLRSSSSQLKYIEDVTGIRVKNYEVDLCDLSQTLAVFEAEKDIAGIIHFAALKTVPESVANPLLYYHNNIGSLVNILKCVKSFEIPHLVFSSSCSVYGNTKVQPVTEQTILPRAESPYGYTKQIGERMISDYTQVESYTRFISLRYFNPVGAHPSGLIGEVQWDKPNNLVPYITQTAIGKMQKLIVFGNDYNTPDGSCIRDYIHVCDVAHAHTLALAYLMNHRNDTLHDVFNLGTGHGTSVFQAIAAFEKVSQVKLNYEIGPRRMGDPAAIYANNELAKEKLHWIPKYTLDDMMLTAWNWEMKMQ